MTFLRPDTYEETLASVAEQTAPLASLVVFDNAPSSANERLAAVLSTETGVTVDYVASSENVGPAGAIAGAMERLLTIAEDDDWVMILNDDMPLGSATQVADLTAFAAGLLQLDPQVGGVGRVGHWFDWQGGRIRRPPPERLSGIVSVDYLATGHAHRQVLPAPMFRVKAIRDSGVYRRDLFIGMTEVEFGLRLRAHGWNLYADAGQWRPSLSLRRGPSARMAEPHWRRYYSLRNLVRVLIDNDRHLTALRVAAVRGIAKPLAWMLVRPVSAWPNLRLNAAAIADAYRGRMGKTLIPPKERTRL